MKKLMMLMLLMVIGLAGCSLPAESLNNGSLPPGSEREAALHGKITYNSLTEMKAARNNGSNSWLKDITRFYYLDETRADVQMNKIEVGEFVTYIDYDLKDEKITFSLQQQRFEDGKLAYQNTIHRSPKGVEGILNGIPYHIARTTEVVVADMAMDDILLDLIFPPDIDGDTLLELLKSIQYDLLPEFGS